MPHPYTEAELDAATWTAHRGVCASCAPATPGAPTDAEAIAMLHCPECAGLCEHNASCVTTGIGPCDDCGDGSRLLASTRIGHRVPYSTREIWVCRNCLVQRHADSCLDLDGVSACPHGWLAGGA